MSFKNIKSEDVERTFYTERVDQALEKKYRDGFDSANQDEQNEETYPLGRFRRDVILCLLIQGRLISYLAFTQITTSLICSYQLRHIPSTYHIFIIISNLT